MSTLIEVFIQDYAFLNPATPFHVLYQTGGVGLPSAKALSYFSTLNSLTDTRTPSTRTVSWPAITSSSLLVDASFYASFITDMTNAGSSYVQSFFAIVDALAFDSLTSTAAETFLTTNAETKVSYVAASSSSSTTNTATTAYSTSTPTSTAITVPDFIKFSILLPQGTGTVQYDIIAYTNSASWISDYPNSTIVGVAPPIDYQTLLTGSLVGNNANIFTTATKSANLNYTSLSTPLDTIDISGYISYPATIFDTLGNSLIMPFNIAYQGIAPSQIQMRQAIANAITASGVGSSTAWKARIPELYVNQRYFLIPLWDVIYKDPKQTIYSGIVNIQAIQAKLAILFPTLDTTQIQADMDYFESNYNKILLVSLPDLSSGGTYTSISTLFPDYQSYGTTDPNFQYMSAMTREWSTNINSVLTYLSGVTTNSSLQVTTDSRFSYVSFTVNSIEYSVLTPTSYKTLLGE